MRDQHWGDGGEGGAKAGPRERWQRGRGLAGEETAAGAGPGRRHEREMEGAWPVRGRTGEGGATLERNRWGGARV